MLCSGDEQAAVARKRVDNLVDSLLSERSSTCASDSDNRAVVPHSARSGGGAGGLGDPRALPQLQLNGGQLGDAFIGSKEDGSEETLKKYHLVPVPPAEPPDGSSFKRPSKRRQPSDAHPSDEVAPALRGG